METENSRRPFVRSREPDLKKPRLSQELILAVDRSSNGRPSFMQRPATSGSAASRRVSDSVGDSYPLVQQQQHLELVNEYKTALAELTFNSKPIITNLTIIAGENLDAAKAIAATICSNIIEVPSEQKLPSLYLLDSIVKNIGRDYIKYFGSKLPEVFCKAYRQVDPPVHTSMKHLFGTWKGVFPPQPLQAIEKELGFSAAANRLPVGTSRVDVPVSRPAHSIHVNPKYLEARQRLQQSSKAKAANSDPSENVVSSTVGHERMSLGSERAWVDSSTKQNSQYTQRELNNVSRTKNISVPVGESEYDSDINQSGFEISQGREKFTGNGRGTVLSTQRNGFDTKNGLPNYHLNSKRALNHGLTDQSTIQTTDHWKDSEEEEYMWDDINSRAGDRDDAANSVRDRWPLDDSEKTNEASIDYLSTEMKDQEVFGNRALSPWSLESHLPERLGSVSGRTIPGLSERHTTYSTTNGRTSFQSKVARGSSIGSSVYGTSNSRPLGSSISVVPQRQTLGSSSPSAQSLLYPPGSSSFAGCGIHHNHTDHDMPHSGFALESKTDTDLCTKLGQEALALPSPDSKRIMSPNAPSSFSVTPNSRQHELESENLESDLTHEIPKQFSHALALTQHVTDANMPVSSLLSSLVAKGLISAAKTKSTTSNNTSQKLGLETTRSAVKTKSTTSNTSQNLGLETTRSAVKTKSTTSNTSQNLGLETTRPAMKTKSTASNTSQNLGLETIFGSSKVSVPIVSLPKSSSSITSELSSDKPVSASTSLIGFHFKGDVLRVLHPSVISSLFNDFQHKCEVCEARLKIQDQVGRHMKWHNLSNQKNNSKKASGAWYAADFVNTLDESSGPQEGGLIKRLDCTELKVPADESQCLCVLCGELFEDYYDQGIAQWMFKGAVYATVPCSNVIGGIINEAVEQGSIVHEKCINKA